MRKYFNTTGLCYPDEHYMVNIDGRLDEIKELVDRGEYFAINRARQYGKTTTIHLLADKLSKDYAVFSISFGGLEREVYESADRFCLNFYRLLNDELNYNAVEGISALDQASNHDIFLTFLGMLRKKYLARRKQPTFRAVILASVYDIKNLKLKMCPAGEHQYNSPWNIAADFTVDMSFSVSDIAGMLRSYEQDAGTGMNISYMAELLYEYTSGYPFLVSRLCKILDENVLGRDGFPNLSSVWTKDGFLEAVRELLLESDTLFDDMVKKLDDFPTLKQILYRILFNGERIPYNTDNPAINLGLMFGFIKLEEGAVKISNRIFETRIYNLFISEELMDSDVYQAASADKDRNRFIQNGRLDMEQVLERFAETFTDIYSDAENKFLEENGRRFFLLYLKPIINGVGNYYVEARTRNMRRTDVVIDYRGEQFVCELKIWHGEEYNTL